MNGREKTVSLPHSWNAADGTSKDYIRTRCVYKKELLPSENNTFLLVEGANSVAEIIVNGNKINAHKGGYSAFVTDLTPYIKNGCTLEIAVDKRF